MKKKNQNKLSLGKEVVGLLTNDQLRQIKGGEITTRGISRNNEIDCTGHTRVFEDPTATNETSPKKVDINF